MNILSWPTIFRKLLFSSSEIQLRNSESFQPLEKYGSKFKFSIKIILAKNKRGGNRFLLFPSLILCSLITLIKECANYHYHFILHSVGSFYPRSPKME